MPKFRKKPVVIEAMRLDPDDLSIVSVLGWMFAHGCNDFKATGDTKAVGIATPTPEGVMQADPGDWIIRGIQGEFYPCKPDIFEATYEQVSA